MKTLYALLVYLLLPLTLFAQMPITVMVTPADDHLAISPLIYGVNNSRNAGANIASRRQGGDRYTTYNWENNASNSGLWSTDPQYANLQHISDAFLTGGTPNLQPGKVLTDFHDASIVDNCYSVLTLPTGYVARDIDGVVTPAQAIPDLSRWRTVRYRKGTPFTLTPDASDANVYIDELLNFLINKYGTAASSTGVKGYGVSNEPGLWTETHPRSHPVKDGYEEIFSITTSLASVVKDMDPAAEVYGGVTFGFSEMKDFQDAPDKGNFPQYKWYIDAFLANMKAASVAAGRTLVDVLDVHWYSEAEGAADNKSVAWYNDTPDLAAARIQAPRSLWDASFVEKSWITGGDTRYSHTNEVFGAKPIALLQRLNQSINTYSPGMKIAIGEFGYGGYDHISGGLAVADALGIFGANGVYYANHWDDISSYVESAYKLFRNYDGSKSTFGNTRVRVTTSDIENSSAYASIQNQDVSGLNVVFINKSLNQPVSATIQIIGATMYKSARVYGFDQSGTNVEYIGSVANIVDNSFKYDVPALAAYHFVVSTGSLGVSNDNQQRTIGQLSITPSGAHRYRVLVDGIGSGSISVADALGKTVLVAAIRDNAYEITVDLRECPQGAYFLRAVGANGIRTAKLLK